jgi:hypothetical protein
MTRWSAAPARPAERLLLPGLGVDERIAAAVEGLAGALEPDPLFERRLRGLILNRHAAARERLVASPRDGRRAMGRLGRAVLNASVVLALGVSAVGAAAQDAVPGVPLYDIKLRLEEVRLRIAPPSVQPVLVEMALNERIEELTSLVAANDWSHVPEAIRRVSRAERLLAQAATAPGASRAASRRADAALAQVLAAAPLDAAPGLQRAIEAHSASGAHRDTNPAAPADQPGRGAPTTTDAPPPAEPTRAGRPSPSPSQGPREGKGQSQAPSPATEQPGGPTSRPSPPSR